MFGVVVIVLLCDFLMELIVDWVVKVFDYFGIVLDDFIS